ncbi:MAG: TspO/MBR family protein [Alphaproteobacteria bacterium]
MNTILKFIFAMVVSFIPGILGRMFTPSGGSDVWFNTLNKSFLTPDGWVFGVAWTLLYAILGVALFLILKNNSSACKKSTSYWLFVAHMVLNAGWTFLFFGLQMPVPALLVLLGLISVSLWMSREFYYISRTASYLVWPYIAWLVFALYLNGTIVLMN